MQVEIVKGPGNAAARVKLTQNETLSAEGGSMIAMRGDFDMKTSTHQRSRSIIGGLKRLIGGESFFLNHYTAQNPEGEVILSGTLPGDMVVVNLSNVGIIAEGGTYVCSGGGVEMDLSWQGLKSIFSGENLFWLKMQGLGPVVLSSFGAIYQVQVDGEYSVDTGHILAFEETLNFSMSKAGKSWLSSYLGGEGLVCRFKGRGLLWCQSHDASAFGKLVGPLLRPR